MNIKPMSLSKSIWFFIISSVIIYIGLYYGIPVLESQEIPFFIGYLLLFHIPLFLLIITALIMYFVEGNTWSWAEFKKRNLLKKMQKMDWVWAIGLFGFGILAYVLLTPVGKVLASYNFFTPPDFFPAEINPNKIPQNGYMMDYKLSGQYWVAFVYFIAWITNILGEELLFRGMIFPRQIKQYGKKAWIFHAIIWTLWHFFWKWNLISILPFGLALSYTIYKRQNVWISIIAHGAMNSIPLILIIIQIIK